MPDKLKKGGMSVTALRELLESKPHLAADNPEALRLAGLTPNPAYAKAPLEVCMAGPLVKCSCSRCKASRPKERKKSASEIFMAAYLEKALKEEKIAAYKYEAITLVVGEDRCRYTPDFVVWPIRQEPILFIEMKGAKKWEDSIIKFKAAKHAYPHFSFEMWEYTSSGGLTQLY